MIDRFVLAAITMTHRSSPWKTARHKDGEPALSANNSARIWRAVFAKVRILSLHDALGPQPLLHVLMQVSE